MDKPKHTLKVLQGTQCTSIRLPRAEVSRHDIIAELARRFAVLEAQRDELLAACKAAWGYLPRNSDAAEDVFQKVNAAIKKAEGE